MVLRKIESPVGDCRRLRRTLLIDGAEMIDLVHAGLYALSRRHAVGHVPGHGHAHAMRLGSNGAQHIGLDAAVDLHLGEAGSFILGHHGAALLGSVRIIDAEGTGAAAVHQSRQYELRTQAAAAGDEVARGGDEFELPPQSRAVVTPAARYAGPYSTWAKCACISQRPGRSVSPRPSITAAPLGMATVARGPAAAMLAVADHHHGIGDGGPPVPSISVAPVIAKRPWARTWTRAESAASSCMLSATELRINCGRPSRVLVADGFEGNPPA